MRTQRTRAGVYIKIKLKYFHYLLDLRINLFRVIAILYACAIPSERKRFIHTKSRKQLSARREKTTNIEYRALPQMPSFYMDFRFGHVGKHFDNTHAQPHRYLFCHVWSRYEPDY